MVGGSFGRRVDASSRANILRQPASGQVRIHRGRRSGTVGLALVLGAAACGNALDPDLGDLEALPCLASDNPVAFQALPSRAPPAAVTTGNCLVGFYQTTMVVLRGLRAPEDALRMNPRRAQKWVT